MPGALSATASFGADLNPSDLDAQRSSVLCARLSLSCLQCNPVTKQYFHSNRPFPAI